MQKMGPRVLAIIPSAFCFGLQNVTLASFERISSKIPCHFLITKWNDGEFPRRLQRLGIPFTGAWLGMFSRVPDWHNLKMTVECLFKLPSAYLVLLRLIRRFRPTRIFLANHHEAILLWPVLIFVRKKVVCHMHDPPPSIPFQKVSFAIWRRAIGRFVFISHNARDRMARLGPLRRSDVVIWNGVAVQELNLPRQRGDLFRQQFNWPKDCLVVGLTGQMASTKGHADFVEAAALVADANPRARFVIGGKSSEPFFSTLKTMIRKRGLDDMVRFSGWLETATQFFDAIDLFVLASRHDEGFGLVLAEAGERGLASVATRSGGATEIIVNHETGILVEKAKATEMAAAVQKLLAEEQLREDMGGRARERVIKFFNLTRQSEKMEKLLASA
jgi:glycosyltransferase involved in cell wall biosynthesis